MLVGVVLVGSCNFPTRILAEELPTGNTEISTVSSGFQPSSVEGEILVKYRDQSVNLQTASGQEASENIMVTQDLIKKESIDAANIALVKVPDNTRTTSEAIAELEQDPRVEYAQPNYQYYTADIGTNDTYAGDLWGLDNSNDTDIDAPEAWGLSEGSGGVVVAVIDTGVAYNHPDLT